MVEEILCLVTYITNYGPSSHQFVKKKKKKKKKKSKKNKNLKIQKKKKKKKKLHLPIIFHIINL
jgi:hypothetical protein